MLALLCFVAVMPATTQARTAEPPNRPTPEPGSELTISVLTMGVGAELWERFGHNAIVVEDRAQGTSIAYNFGMFSFTQDNFVLRFVQGRLTYWMEGFDTEQDLARYVRRKRSIWQQELDFTPAQRIAMRDALERNALEENRYYRYDYYLDNCSTRVRDALDRVLDGAIERQSRMPGSGSFRFHTLRLNANNPPLYAGMGLLLGSTADRPVTRWEEMFLPLKLRDYLREVRIPDGAGGFKPLVRSERVIFETDAYPVPDAPPPWFPGFLALGLAIGGWLAWSGRRYGSTGSGRGQFIVPGVIVGLVVGVAGAVLAGMWAFTDHVATSRNENILQATILALALGFLLPLARSNRPGMVRVVRSLAWMVGGLSLAGVLLKLLPFSHQVNGQVLALLVPINLGLAAGVLLATGREAVAPR